MPFQPELEARVGERMKANDIGAAAEALLRGYGSELYGFLVVRLQNKDDADEAFAMLCEDVWRGLPSFRGEASFRTWAYRLARHAASRLRRGDGRRKRRFLPGGTTAAEKVAHEIRSTTAVFQRTDVKDRLRALRDELSDEEREILALRIDRGLDWREIARICAEDDVDDAEITRLAALFRKRFERTKERLRVLAEKAGLIPS